jgi:hypothetical protein
VCKDELQAKKSDFAAKKTKKQAEVSFAQITLEQTQNQRHATVMKKKKRKKAFIEMQNFILSGRRVTLKKNKNLVI